MRIHFASRISLDHIDFGLVHESNHLHIVRRLGELYSRDRSRREDARSVPRLGTPSNHLAFDLADGLPWDARGPEAEIYGGKGRSIEDVMNRMEGSRVPSSELIIKVWQSDASPSVVELQIL